MFSLEELLEEKCWTEFYEYKKWQGNITEKELIELQSFIADKKYIDPVEKMLANVPFSPPRKVLIGKKDTKKKRTVYIYSYEENMALKMLAWKLREYDYLFSDRLYSFRKHLDVRTALRRITGTKNIDNMYSYKIDISNYFNSIPVDEMLQILCEKLDNSRLYEFFRTLLNNPNVEYEGKIITEEKGVMAGNPTANFLANVYLSELDYMFDDILYARYSDDIILFAEDENVLEQKAKQLKEYILSKGLEINSKKEFWTGKGEPWTFLGITRDAGKLDVSKASIKKLKGKLHRRARALERWKRRKNAAPKQAVKAYIRAVNRLLMDNPKHTETTWCRWYFPIINTDESIRELDHYIQACIRYVAFGNYGKKTYSLRYEDMKDLGYQSLVHKYYNVK